MNLPERAPSQVRIGIAIEVPEPFGTELHQARAGFGDAYASSIPPHITIIPPTVVDESVLPAVCEHLAKVADDAPPFRVHLRGSGTFRPISPVVFVAVAEGIAECELLELSVRSGVLAQDLRFNYHPHVTVAHEVPDADLDRAFKEMAGYEAAFDVEDVWLYEHGDDGVWRKRRRFALRG